MLAETGNLDVELDFSDVDGSRHLPLSACRDRRFEDAVLPVRSGGRAGRGISRAGGGWPRPGGTSAMSPGWSVIT
jgi:hypothetical protein